MQLIKSNKKPLLNEQRFFETISLLQLRANLQHSVDSVQIHLRLSTLILLRHKGFRLRPDTLHRDYAGQVGGHVHWPIKSPKPALTHQAYKVIDSASRSFYTIF